MWSHARLRGEDCPRGPGHGRAGRFSGQDAGLPEKSVNVRDLGAVGDGVADDTRAIESALREAQGLPTGRALYLPAGTYRYTRNIRVDGVAVHGDGADRTILVGSDGRHLAWVLTGDSPSIRDLSIRAAKRPSARDTHDTAVGLEANLARNFSMVRVGVGPVDSAGIMVRRSGGAGGRTAVVRDCVVRGTLADGIHITAASHDIEVSGNRVGDTGDDFIAVVSYRADRGLCHDISIHDNTVADQSHGRGISVVGGTGVSIASNSIKRSSGAGIYLASEAGYDTYGDAEVRVLRNRLSDVATDARLGHGAILLVGRPSPELLEPALEVKDVWIEGNSVDGASRNGLYLGAYASGVTVIGNSISNTHACGISVYPRVADISIGSADPGSPANIVGPCGESGIEVDPAGSRGALRISGVVFRSLNTRNIGHADAVRIGPNSGFATISITGNRLGQPAGHPLTRFIEALSPVNQDAGNTADAQLGGSLPHP